MARGQVCSSDRHASHPGSKFLLAAGRECRADFRHSWGEIAPNRPDTVSHLASVRHTIVSMTNPIVFPSEGDTLDDCSAARARDQRCLGRAGCAPTLRGPRTARRSAGGKDARISCQACPGRDREMGGANQDERREHGLSRSSSYDDGRTFHKFRGKTVHRRHPSAMRSHRLC
jgi:hypothetical protein